MFKGKSEAGRKVASELSGFQELRSVHWSVAIYPLPSSDYMKAIITTTERGLQNTKHGLENDFGYPGNMFRKLMLLNCVKCRKNCEKATIMVRKMFIQP